MNDDCEIEFASSSQETSAKHCEEGADEMPRGPLARGSSPNLDHVRELIESTASVFAPRGHTTQQVLDVDALVAKVSADTRDLIRETAELFAPRKDAGSETRTATAAPVRAQHDAAGAALAAAIANVDSDLALDAGEPDEDEDELPEAPPVSRKIKPRVRTRRMRPRSKTIAMKRLTRAELQRGALANPPVEGAQRPLTRAECAEGQRPCPWVACKHHLYLDINPKTGSIKLNFPDLEPWELQHTCALDVADNGGLTLEEIGLITNLTRERVRQVEVRGLLTLKARSHSLK